MRLTRTSLHGTPTLCVLHFERRLDMTMVFGPIWKASGELMGVELLSRPRDHESGLPVCPEHYFSCATAQDQLSIFRWQLKLIRPFVSWLRLHHLMVSINITRPLAQLALQTPSVMADLAGARAYLRLEISEHFMSSGIVPSGDPLIVGLKERLPLWLDDFGVGAVGLSGLLGGVFEFVKLDRALVRMLQKRQTGHGYLERFTSLCAECGTQIIAEGIENDGMMVFSREAGIPCFQGWLWPEVAAHELASLPLCLPSTALHVGMV